MKIERLLQTNIAVLTVIGTLLLGLGQDNPMLPALSLFAAVTSIYFTDVMGWFRLHRVIANLAALAALFISLREFDLFGGDSASQLGAIASLLVYLQFVLLYQEKNQRVYWQLVVLSVLQVVVAAALHLGVEFGMLLVVYMFTALSAMSLLFVHRHVEALHEEHRRTAPTPRLNVAAPPRAWSATAAPAAIRQCSDDEIVRSLLGWPFLERLLATGIATLAIAVVAFYATPRLGDAVWRGAQRGGPRVVGFNREIHLGDMGRLLQSNEPALRLKFIDQNGNGFSLAEPPYIRGAALTDYRFSGDQGHWSQPTSMNTLRLEELRRPRRDASWVTMEVVLEPTRSPLLFSVGPVYRIENTPKEIRYDSVDDQLVRSETGPLMMRLGEYRYAVATTGIVRGKQNVISPRRPSQYWVGASADYEWEQLVHLDWNLELIPQVTEAALREAGVPRDNTYQVAKALEAHFHLPGRYRYTLDQTDLPPRPRTMDPIEHFLVNHRSGHCEYFASALVLMLRSQQIPARVVVGYRGGEFNAFGKYYDVRQRDAHAWVEAYLLRDQLPEELRAQVSERTEGVWLRLDPTPPAFRDGTTNDRLSPLSQATDYLEAVWNDHVLGLNSSRQRQAIYAPLVERVRWLYYEVTRLTAGVADQGWWRHFVRTFIRSMGIDPPNSRFPWKTLTVVLLLSVSLILLLRAAWRNYTRRGYGRQLRRWLRQARHSTSHASASSLAFYRRFEKLLARRRFRRPLHQTQREFAAQVAAQLGPAQGDAAPLLEQVVETFYRIRFGRRPLDRAEAEAIENTLEQLEQTLAQRGS